MNTSHTRHCSQWDHDEILAALRSGATAADRCGQAGVHAAIALILDSGVLREIMNHLNQDDIIACLAIETRPDAPPVATISDWQRLLLQAQHIETWWAVDIADTYDEPWTEEPLTTVTSVAASLADPDNHAIGLGHVVAALGNVKHAALADCGKHVAAAMLAASCGNDYVVKKRIPPETTRDTRGGSRATATTDLDEPPF